MTSRDAYEHMLIALEVADTWSADPATRFGTTWQRLAAVNHLANPDRIFPGEVLRVA